jgi:CheY-like chemotaxis protein
VKYGALSVPGGTISVSWVREGNGLRLCWEEHSDLTISEPRQMGFGTFLISEGLEHQLNGRSTMEYRDHGVAIHIWLPDKRLAWSPAPEPDAGAGDNAFDEPQGARRLHRVLVVEDDFLIAVEHRTFLLEGGVDHVITANSNASALRHMREVLPDAAVIDVNLGTENSHETAAFLKARGIPFVFLTGYSADPHLLDAFPDVPILKKPVDPDTLLPALKTLVRGEEKTSGIYADPRA